MEGKKQVEKENYLEETLKFSLIVVYRSLLGFLLSTVYGKLKTKTKTKPYLTSLRD